MPLFWTSGDVCPGFQSQVGFPHLRASWPAHNGFLKFTSSATPADLEKYSTPGKPGNIMEFCQSGNVRTLIR